MENFKYTFVALFCLTLLACGNQGNTEEDGSGAGASGQAMLSIANPHAAEAAMEILRDGGTAIDAAIAAQAILSLVEPQSSGIGGGAFLLYYDAAAGTVQAYDGREMAPRSTRPEHFLGPDGTARGFADIVRGGTAVGVPGVMAMLEMVHDDHGALPWSGLFEAGIELSETGFSISPRLRFFITRAPWTRAMPDTFSYLFDESGEPLPEGHTLVNQDHADSLRLIANQGASVLYEGELADAIVTRVNSSEINPGAMTLEDLSGYRALERDVICTPYRSYQICGMPPPTSGGLVVEMILAMLEDYDLASMGPNSPEAIHLISQASRLAYADRALYMADADFVAVPVRGLLSEEYLDRRAALIDPDTDMGTAEAGNPWPEDMPELAPDLSPDVPGTSHLSIVDSFGNAIAMTTTVESIFGSNLMVGGFFLNNQMTDFSHEAQRNGRPIANAPAPGKRPRSSMAPIIILDEEGAFFAALGSGGGSRIPLYVLQSIISIVDWDMSMQEALDQPHFLNRNGSTELEAGSDLAAIAPALVGRGHQVRNTVMNSGTHGIMIRDGVMDGGADPRREGVVLSDRE